MNIDGLLCGFKFHFSTTCIQPYFVLRIRQVSSKGIGSYGRSLPKRPVTHKDAGAGEYCIDDNIIIIKLIEIINTKYTQYNNE